PVFDVRSYGARGDGKTLDTDAINRAITAASAAGGGTVYFPAGTYASFSIHLKSHIGLYLEHGATLLAADSSRGDYDAPEPNVWGEEHHYQDFGHSHWHNSLIWGENVEDVSIEGPGRIYGKGLSRGIRLDMNTPGGGGNKSIALKLAHNVVIRDVSILHGGHFAILLTGVDNVTIDNVKIDTNRDGIDVDGCRNVRISNTAVNSPWDDAIVFKTSYGLGYVRPTENVTLTNSFVSGGYEEGTLLDGTFKPYGPEARVSHTGRVKFGTESNGDFRNITISNVVFDRSQGLALESVDGSHLEDVSISNLTMRHIVNAPIFIRLGRRMRGPDSLQVGAIRRVSISNVVVYDSNAHQAVLITGIPGHPIEDLRLSDIQLNVAGGAPKTQAAVTVPEQETEYPEPGRFGALPAYGFFIRHVKGLRLNDVEVSYLEPDARPAFVLEDVHDADFHHVTAEPVAGSPTYVLRNVGDFRTENSRPVGDVQVKQATEKSF
ncbi:MAG TPA: glycoside hydrolase family 28 protein, partial [Longimicrobiaceae bacterium]|nr:glycoside hydrolase family 28 protein [Longimicrobiaceae bacterium]